MAGHILDSAHAAAPARPTWAEVDLTALSDNLDAVRRVARPAQVFAVVKADAYGHGLLRVSQQLEREGVDGLCVALAEEGMRLRAAGVRVPVLVLNGAYGQSHEAVVRAGLTPVVYAARHVHDFAAALPGRSVAVHLKVDTGMARLGVTMEELPELLQVLAAHRNIELEGVMTHLSSAESDLATVRAQLERFEQALSQVRAAGHRPRFVHAANSAAALGVPESRYSLARVGLALYGASPRPDLELPLRPAMRVRSEVLSLREISVGSPVGYNGTFVASRPTRIATIPIGYGDGLLRAASDRGAMLVGGRRCPIVGRISMDLTALDVTELPSCAVGDEVVVIGSQGAQTIAADELARAANTIAYEVLTSLSARVPRYYRVRTPP